MAAIGLSVSWIAALIFGTAGSCMCRSTKSGSAAANLSIDAAGDKRMYVKVSQGFVTAGLDMASTTESLEYAARPEANILVSRWVFDGKSMSTAVTCSECWRLISIV